MKLATAALLPLLLASCAPPVGEEAEALTQYCPGANTLEGVDVSEFQGSVDWNQVKQSGRAFAFARVSDGLNHVDPYFAANWSGIKAAGLVRGVYQFFEPTEDGTAQADLLLGKIGTLGPGDLPPAIDVEQPSFGTPPPAQYAAAIQAWVTRVQQATGRTPIVYTGAYYWPGAVQSSAFSSDPLWLPSYGTTCPYLPPEWSSWVIHQYSSTGAVPGIAGQVDVDLFNGTIDALHALAAGSAPQSVPPDYRIALAAGTSGCGYWVASADGGVFSLGGAPFFGSLGGIALNAPIVAMAGTATGHGYWLAGADGGIFSFGDARFFGSLGGTNLNAPIVGMVATPDDGGYWMVASDGGVFAFGDAAFYGSLGGTKLNAPIVGMARTADGKGYWLVGADGGVFSYGDAAFYGSLGGTKLNAPIVAVAATLDGKGYWLVGADGGIFSYGDAAFYGSLGGKTLARPITAIAVAPDGKGYWLLGGDGGVFAFGSAPFGGSAVAPVMAQPTTAGCAPAPTGSGGAPDMSAGAMMGGGVDGGVPVDDAGNALLGDLAIFGRDAAPVGSDGASGGSDGSTRIDGGAGVDAATGKSDGGGAAGMNGGCSCSTGRSRPTAPLALVLVLALTRLRRRRARR